MISSKDQLVKKLIPEKLLVKYTDFEIVAETSYYKIFEATSISNFHRYAIRALDLDSDFVKSNINDSTTLFLQEILCLCLRLGSSETSIIRVEDFVINYELNQIGFVMSAQVPIQVYLEGSKAPNQRSELDIERLLKNVASDLDFIYNRMKLFSPNISKDKIFYVREIGLFFLGDWATAATIGSIQQEVSLNSLYSITSPSKQNGIQTSNSMPLIQSQKVIQTFDSNDILEAITRDIYTFGVIGLEASGVDQKFSRNLKNISSSLKNLEYKAKLDDISNELAKLRHSELVRSTIVQMLQKDPEMRISLDEIINGRWRKIYIGWSSFGTNRVAFQDVRSRESFEIQGAQLEWGGI